MGWSLPQARACSELCHSQASISSMQTLSPPLPAPHGVFRIQLRVPLNLDPRRPHPLQPDPSKSSLPLLLVHSSTINSRIPLIFPLNIPGPLPFPPESSPRVGGPGCSAQGPTSRPFLNDPTSGLRLGWLHTGLVLEECVRVWEVGRPSAA